MRFDVWQSVKVTKEDHPRTGQAGTVHATSPAHPDEVQVKWDSDGTIESVSVDDLTVL